jgi:hypothetical protein
MEELNIVCASILKNRSRLLMPTIISPDGLYVVEASVRVVLWGYVISMSYSGFLLDTGKPSSVQEPASPTRMELL